MFQSSSKAITYLLICSLIGTQVLTAIADVKKIPVAFLGIEFDNLPQEAQDRILERLMGLFTTKSSLDLRKPQSIRDSVGAEKFLMVLKNRDQSSLLQLADELQVSYIYGGRLSNNARDGERLLLVGELYRYDRQTNLRHKFEVLKYYDNFGVELIRFDEQFVKTIISEHKSGPKILPLLVLGGVVVAGILAFALVRTESGVAGSTSPSPDPPLHKKNLK